jgi:site-specific recombinase XerD
LISENLASKKTIRSSLGLLRQSVNLKPNEDRMVFLDTKFSEILKNYCDFSKQELKDQVGRLEDQLLVCKKKIDVETIKGQ